MIQQYWLVCMYMCTPCETNHELHYTTVGKYKKLPFMPTGIATIIHPKTCEYVFLCNDNNNTTTTTKSTPRKQ